MAFTLIQGGTTLYGMDQRGSIVSLALPSGVTIDPSLRPRFAVLGNYAVIVNSPSRPLAVDANLNVRVLTPNPPTGPMTLAGTGSSTLSGTFTARQTFIVRDQFGNVISESDFGPTANSATITNQFLQFSNINISPLDAVSASRLYRTTTGTAVYFKEADLDGNTQTTFQDNLSDAGLATFSAPPLGSPPDLSLISEFKSRLWGVSKTDVNHIVYTETGFSYAWPGDNFLAVPRLGSDARGCTGFARRRDALGFGRSNGFYQIVGTSDTDIRIVNISENCGIEAPDSVAVYQDTAFFLWKDGVYRWDNSGLKNVATNKIERWFTRNGTFNLDRLQFAFAHIDPLRKKYRLFLASTGSSAENCWIEYDFVNDRWWGPHMSHAFKPSSAFIFQTDSGLTLPMVGGADGFCRLDRAKRTDDVNTGIDFDVVTTRDIAGLPDDEKYFGEISVSGKPQPRGELAVYATAGEADAFRKSRENEAPFQYDMTQSRQRLGRVGVGKAFKLRFRNNQPGEDVNLRGYEVPVRLVGKR